MTKIEGIFFLLLFILSFGYEKKVFTKKNIVVAYLQVNETFNFTFKTRGRFGYSFCAFSESATSLSNGLVLFSYVKDLEEVVLLQFNPNNNLTISPKDSTNKTFAQNPGSNYFPLGDYFDDYNIRFAISKSVYPSFSNSTWVHVGFRRKDSNVSPTSFNSNLDEFISVQVQNVSFEDFQYSKPVSRIEFLHYGVLIAYFIFVAFILILSFVFLKKQPLKSRGIIPFVSCICHILISMTGIPFYLFSLEDYKYYCIIIYIENSVLLVLLFLTSFHYSRYLLILNIHQGKQILMKNKENNQRTLNIKWKWKLVKLFGKGYIQTIFVLLAFSLFLLSFFIGYFAQNFKCSFTNYWVSIYYYTLTAIMFFFILLLIVIDLILNLKLFKKCLICKMDTFYYRFELAIAIILVTPFFVISKSLDPDFQVKYRKIFRLTLETTNILVSAILNSLAQYFLFFSLSLFPLIITIIKELYKLCYPPPRANVIIDILNNSNGRKIFTEYSNTEWASENISCYDEITRYKEEKDLSKRKEIALNIYSTYLNGNDSQCEINISRSICEELKVSIDNDKLMDDIFIKVEPCLIENMIDTYSRFQQTNEFKQYKTREKFLGSYRRIPDREIN